mmetsp:Transcript_37707/g.66275  ORF Transcript_37707/g.66275 Transcript_37707/m.66275 type:complete len:202 (-) Transcript_37707:510-1115(-)
MTVPCRRSSSMKLTSSDGLFDVARCSENMAKSTSMSQPMSARSKKTRISPSAASSSRLKPSANAWTRSWISSVLITFFSLLRPMLGAAPPKFARAEEAPKGVFAASNRASLASASSALLLSRAISSSSARLRLAYSARSISNLALATASAFSSNSFRTAASSASRFSSSSRSLAAAIAFCNASGSNPAGACSSSCCFFFSA